MNTQFTTNTDNALLAQMGSFIKEMRISQNKTQQHIAESCGINRSTYLHIENGRGSSMLHFIKVLRALNALELLQHFKVDNSITISPIAMAKSLKNKRQRATKSNLK